MPKLSRRIEVLEEQAGNQPEPNPWDGLLPFATTAELLELKRIVIERDHRRATMDDLRWMLTLLSELRERQKREEGAQYVTPETAGRET